MMVINFELELLQCQFIADTNLVRLFYLQLFGRLYIYPKIPLDISLQIDNKFKDQIFSLNLMLATFNPDDMQLITN